MKPTLFQLNVAEKEIDGQNVAEIDIDGVIGFDFWSDDPEKNTKERMREQLKEVDAIQADKIIVNISSLGGDVDHGLAIHDLLANNSAEVETRVIGMTASAATIIAQAGDIRTMSDNALYLVHRAWTVGMGNANDFEALAKDLVKLDGRISNIYSKRSEKTEDDFMDLMNESNGDGIWISAEEAKEYGLIDSITEPMKAAALDVSMFDKYEIPKPPQANEFEKDGRRFISSLSKEDYANSSVDESFTLRIGRDVIRGALTKPLRASSQEENIESTDVESVSASSRERELTLLNLKR